MFNHSSIIYEHFLAIKGWTLGVFTIYFRFRLQVHNYIPIDWLTREKNCLWITKVNLETPQLLSHFQSTNQKDIVHLLDFEMRNFYNNIRMPVEIEDITGNWIVPHVKITLRGSGGGGGGPFCTLGDKNVNIIIIWDYTCCFLCKLSKALVTKLIYLV